MFYMGSTGTGVYVSDRLFGNGDHIVVRAICQELAES